MLYLPTCEESRSQILFSPTKFNRGKLNWGKNASKDTTYLWLNIRIFATLAPRKSNLFQRHFGLFKETQKSQFLGTQNEQGVAFGTLATSCASNTMNIISGFISRIELNNQIHCRNIQSTSRNIRAQQDARISITELKESCRSLVLSQPPLFKYQIRQR